MNYRLIVTDLDGTLLNSHTAISEANIAALQDVIDRGIAVAIASGRRYAPFALETARQIGRPVFLILCNGAVVLGPDLCEVLLRRALAPEDTAWLLALVCRRQNILFNIHSDELDLLYQREDGGPPIADIPPESWTPLSAAEELLTRCGSELLRVRVWASDREIDALRETAADGRFSVERYPYPGQGDSYLEFLAQGVSKTTAIEFVAKRMGLGLEHVVAFGDGTNDVEMLASVGLGIAVANATDAAKLAAKMLTETNDEDGVARAIARLFG